MFINVTQTGVTVTSGAASANVALPKSQNNIAARRVRLVSDKIVYVKLGVDNTIVASANDMMVTTVPVDLYTNGFSFIGYIQDAVTVGGKLNVVPLESV